MLCASYICKIISVGDCAASVGAARRRVVRRGATRSRAARPAAASPTPAPPQSRPAHAEVLPRPRRAPRGSGICVDRRVQFVFHPRFQHIFVRGKTGKDGKDLFLPTDGFLHWSKRGEVTSYGSCLIHPSSWSFFIFSTYVGID